MLKLKTTVAACLVLSAIGGILAYASRNALSHDTDKNVAAAQASPRALVEAGRKDAAVRPDEQQIAQLLRRPLARRAARDASLAGSVQIAGRPVSGATVTLYAAGIEAPAQLAQGNTNENGQFSLDGSQAPEGSVLYIVAKGGTPKAATTKGPNDALGLMAVLGSTLPRKLTVNEFTTIASVMTCAQFLKNETLSGKSLGLHIAAGNVPNFVDLETGGYGGTIADALNSAQTPTMANFATLASVMAGAITQVTTGRVQPILRRSHLTNRRCPDEHIDGG